jgi:hypothetical protein
VKLTRGTVTSRVVCFGDGRRGESARRVVAYRPRGSANFALPDPRMFNKPPSGDKGLPMN